MIEKSQLKVKPTLGEIFAEIAKGKTRKDRIELLRKHDSLHLRCLLRLQFDDRYESAMPGDDAPYTPNECPVGMGYTHLLKECKKLYRFVKGGAPQMKPMKREQLYIQLLESLDAQEAKLLNDLLHKKYKGGLTLKLVQEALPDLDILKNKKQSANKKEVQQSAAA